MILQTVVALLSNTPGRCVRSPRIDIHRPKPYWLGRVGDNRRMENEAYQTARSGGRNSGLLKNYSDLPDNLVEKAIRSLERQIDLHRGYAADPYLKVPRGYDPEKIGYLVHEKWPKEILRFSEEIDVLRGLLEDRKR